MKRELIVLKGEGSPSLTASSKARRHSNGGPTTKQVKVTLGSTGEQVNKNAPKPVACGGITYQSVGAFSRAFNLNASTVRGLLLKGVDPGTLIPASAPASAPVVPTHYQVGFLRFDNLEELSLAFSVPIDTIRSRLLAAWSVAQAVGVLPPPLSALPDIHVMMVKTKREQSVSNPVTVRSKRNDVVYDGKTYKSLRALASEVGISPHVLRYQAVTLGYGVGAAIELLKAGAQPTPEKTKVARSHIVFKGKR